MRTAVKNMRRVHSRAILLGGVLLCALSSVHAGSQADYPWLEHPSDTPLWKAFSPPEGFARVEAPPGSFAAWLRGLPLRTDARVVRLYDGRAKSDQGAHLAIVDIDVGPRDLQQCADAVIRLRAEYLFARGCADDVVFDFTSGDPARFRDWARGVRPRVDGRRVEWRPAARPDASHASFRRYLDVVFSYAGSASLARELRPVARPERPRIGDVYIQGGYPGHAVLIVDVVENAAGERRFMLAQSYMPAQDVHVLRGPERSDSPWYPARASGVLRTPEWRFRHTDLRRFAESACAAGARLE